MDSQGLFIAALLDPTTRAHAASAIARLREQRGAAEIDAWGFSALVADAEVRLRTLAEALAAGEPGLFRLDVEWLAATYAARNAPLDLLEGTLRCLRQELEEGLPASAVERTGAYLDAGLAVLAHPPAAPVSVLGDGPQAELAKRFLLAALEGRRADAEQVVLDAFDGGLGVPDLHRHVVVEAQIEMGRLWQVGEVHVAEEHLGSRIVESVLAVLRARMPRAEPIGKAVLVASVQGNLHDTAARLVADHFEMAGWRSLLLGADIPEQDLVLAVEGYGVDLVALSAEMALHVRSTAAHIEALRESHPNVRVLVGGRPFGALPELWRAVGADGSAPDAESAVAAGARLLRA